MVREFRAGGRLAVADPAPGSATAAPNSPVSWTFAEPVAKVLGSARPRLSPAVPGSWSEPSANTLVFTPTGLGYGFPQSLGCVELPSSAAEAAFHHLAIGDLVTVAS
ncbi:MAG: L,D-transpeptidase family protein [Streptosporangiaceae bacterium]